MRVLVCGGRDYCDVTRGYEVLDRLDVKTIISGAARGADQIGEMWAGERRIPVERFPADWIAYGRAAGPVRNQRMLDEGEPDLVVAFPGGSGTADMVKRARVAGVRVMMIDAAPSPGGTE